MGGLVLSDVMDAIATALETVVTNAHAWPTEAVKTGEAIVGYPQDPVDIGITFGRGADVVTLPVWVLCGLATDKATRDTVSGHITGSSEVVAALEGHDPAGVYSSLAVKNAGVERYQMANGLMHMAVRFDVEVIS